MKVFNKIVVGVACLSPLAFKTCRQEAGLTIKEGQYAVRKMFNSQLEMDKYKDLPYNDSLVKAVQKQVANEAKLKNEVLKKLQNSFGKNDVQGLIHLADSPQSQERILSVLKKIDNRKEKISAYTLSNVISANDAEKFKFNLRLLNAKKEDGKYLSEESINQIIVSVGMLPDDMGIKIADIMIKNNFEEDIIPRIIQSTSGFLSSERQQKSEYALKLLETKGQDGKIVDSPDVILKKISDLKTHL